MLKNYTLKIEPNAINNISDVLSKNKVQGKILYASDNYVDKLYGDILNKQINSFGKVIKYIIEDNTIAYSMYLAEEIIARDINYVVALGGGRVLDTCKFAAHVSKRKLISIPTTMANDGIASPISVLKRKDGITKSLGSSTPSIVIVDTQLIMSSPDILIKAGIGDTISNYTALKDWNLAASKNKETINGYAYIMSKTALDTLISSSYSQLSLPFIDVLCNSIVLSGMSMNVAGNSRPVSGSEHLFSHALDYLNKNATLHGLNVALGTISILKLLNEDYKNILSYLNKFNVDINPKSMSIDKDLFVQSFLKAPQMRKFRYTCLNEINLNPKQLECIYDELIKEL